MYPYINENENLFLSIIEKANGDLNKITDIIYQTGRVIDDISIIKIYYKNN
ncbi:MAG: hypothetical protein KatS3mg129_1104 [Leptospiraceae bacterium]|nr:MAG: hypothetical protein KatS3mg129_1104 [Leptospiraceae bacterium]